MSGLVSGVLIASSPLLIAHAFSAILQNYKHVVPVVFTVTDAPCLFQLPASMLVASPFFQAEDDGWAELVLTYRLFV